MVFARIAARSLRLPRQNLLRPLNANPTSISGKAFNAARCFSTAGVRRAELATVTTLKEESPIVEEIGMRHFGFGGWSGGGGGGDRWACGAGESR